MVFLARDHSFSNIETLLISFEPEVDHARVSS